MPWVAFWARDRKLSLEPGWMVGCANPPLILGVSSLPPRQQFDAWRESACGQGYELSREETSSGFPAEMRLWRCSPFGFARISVPPGRRWRGMGNIRAEPADHWAVSFVARGCR